MKLIYTDAITLTTAEIELKRGETPGSGVLPNNIIIKAISLQPEDITKPFYIKGTHPDSNWVLVPAGNSFLLDNLDSLSNKYCILKAPTGSFTLNIYVLGY